jgi:hypothetical protein
MVREPVAPKKADLECDTAFWSATKTQEILSLTRLDCRAKKSVKPALSKMPLLGTRKQERGTVGLSLGK